MLGTTTIDAPEWAGEVHVPAGKRVRYVASDQARIEAPNLEEVRGVVSIGPLTTLYAPRLAEHEQIVRDRMRHRRRFFARFSTSPHARCARTGRCIEHENDPRIEACAARG